MGSIKKDMFLLECETYQDYLDTFIQQNDLRFVRNLRHCRTLVELGHRSVGTDMYSPEEFLERKDAVREALWPTKRMAVLFSEKKFITDPVLKELAQREQANKQKDLSTIIFLKYRLNSGFEISGYIDYEESLRKANEREEGCFDWDGVFTERIKLRPRPTDLSYYNWHKRKIRYNESDNYKIIHDVDYGVLFMHKGDHKIICMNMKKTKYAGNVTHTMHYSDKYDYVMLYDHVVRRKI